MSTDTNVFNSLKNRNMNGAMMVNGVPHLPRTNIKTQKVNNIDDLLEREKVRRFQLSPQEEEFVYQPEKRIFTFYQFCRMHNPDRTEKNGGNVKIHEMRKLIFDEEYQIISKKEALISARKLEKFINKAPDHKYTLYETYEISSVDLPSDLELYTANSNILNGDSFLPAYQEGEGFSIHND